MAGSKIVLVKYNEDDEPLELVQDAKKKGNPSDKIKPRLVQEKTQPVVLDEKTKPTSELLGKLRTAVNDSGSALSHFKDMLTSLSDVIPDEPTRYAAALIAVSKSYRHSASDILATSDQRRKALRSEGKRFADEIERSKKELLRIETQVKEKDQLVVSLKAQIRSIREERDKLLSKVTSKSESIEVADSELREALSVLSREIEEEDRQLLKYLK